MADDDDKFFCEGCGEEIAAGDKYTVTMDGCYLCETDAPSMQDVVDYWNHHPPEDDEEREAKDDADKALADHIAAGGSPDDKPLMVME